MQETSADYPTFFVYGVPCPVRPAEAARLLEALEASGSQFALKAARTTLAAVARRQQVELDDAESLEVIRVLGELRPLEGSLASLRGQLLAWRDLA